VCSVNSSRYHFYCVRLTLWAVLGRSPNLAANRCEQASDH
jgi:hypothetical protein